MDREKGKKIIIRKVTRLHVEGPTDELELFNNDYKLDCLPFCEKSRKAIMIVNHTRATYTILTTKANSKVTLQINHLHEIY